VIIKDIKIFLSINALTISIRKDFGIEKELCYNSMFYVVIKMYSTVEISLILV
jgi:hypothetical protein